ncbi:MAG TPA: hypothetical protein VN345_06775 [Blastocatellia bacterium]|nr:hypothetical protein [Blastocatellia bacterium]
MNPGFQSLLLRLATQLKTASTRAHLLMGVWLLFLLLVGLGIHGSSLPLTKNFWSPGPPPYAGYLADYLPSFLRPKEPLTDETRQWLMALPRPVRSDEWITETPYALAQLAHKPAFPVINTNMCNGQNMLLWSWGGTPVFHILEFARPSTWGYLLFGAQRGLAWSWWFPVFSCFTVLTLLLEVILKGHIKLAALAAFWFCGSAYVVAWSLRPAYVAMFPALGCLCAYHLLKSTRPRVQIASGILLGLTIPGLLMFLYPPWQVSLGYLFLFVFIGLVWRDRLYKALWPIQRSRAVAIVLAIFIAGGMTFEFLRVCWPAFKVAAATVYPGNREVFTGGDYPPWMFFRGFYSLLTLYNPTAGEHFGNETEAASHYYLFPAVFAALLLSKRLLVSMGPVGWMMAIYLAGMACFALVGIPVPVARFSLIGYAQPTRADVAVGLGSVMLCAYVLTLAEELRRSAASRWTRAVPFIAAAAFVPLLVLPGLALTRLTNDFPGTTFVWVSSLLAGIASYFMLAGSRKIFCGLMTAAVVATTALFNPLSTNLDYIYKSDLAQKVTMLDRQAGHPLWLCYGNAYPGTFVSMMGGRALSGVQWPPQMEFWRQLDPTGANEFAYNRYAHVFMSCGKDSETVSFANPSPVVLQVTISPYHPVLKSLGVRYILATGDSRRQVETAKCRLIYVSRDGNSSIFEIPPSP